MRVVMPGIICHSIIAVRNSIYSTQKLTYNVYTVNFIEYEMPDLSVCFILNMTEKWNGNKICWKKCFVRKTKCFHCTYYCWAKPTASTEEKVSRLLQEKGNSYSPLFFLCVCVPWNHQRKIRNVFHTHHIHYLGVRLHRSPNFLNTSGPTWL